ncbi:GntR family transcriptional regulator [Geodermatophilus sabuli]|uniref:DNA-binding transcriptional regulator, GntR family n=1 Tax=Geodermatophilus sabuli TaxID=1564158 RepID=A0A285EGD4_9ACTN|nr:GntR family transcriptional regulator [Geodermatophilus sabuli]MBB3083063.1 DNA-binding GntR family transcriptional regulator [Geodermatophilus sabuli]SNX98060.1 DNA-binding transcriptional regulator, GntR family [Geodermatophilus sabuli]
MILRAPGQATAAELATAAIREAVITGALKPDEPVYEEEWAARLEISRTPVREAIQELVARGLLSRRGRTAYVFRPSLGELLEIYDIRLPMEQLAASRCATVADDALVRDLEARFAKIQEHRVDSGWYADHEAFHMRLFEGSRMPRLTSLIQSLRAQSEPYVRLAVTVDQEFRDNSRVQHHSLVDAVRAHDPDMAAAIVEEHLATTRRKLSEILQVSAEGLLPLR